MRVLFSGVGECKVYEIIDMPCVPPEGATINFYVDEGDDEDQEWSVRTVVWLPKNTGVVGVLGSYDVYCVVGPPIKTW